jgi:hypothetical protein
VLTCARSKLVVELVVLIVDEVVELVLDVELVVVELVVLEVEEVVEHVDDVEELEQLEDDHLEELDDVYVNLDFFD